jgi:hypothetical protein
MFLSTNSLVYDNIHLLAREIRLFSRETQFKILPRGFPLHFLLLAVFRSTYLLGFVVFKKLEKTLVNLQVKSRHFVNVFGRRTIVYLLPGGNVAIN